MVLLFIDFFFAHGCFISLNENCAQIFKRRNIIFKTLRAASLLPKFFPETDPVYIISITQLFHQQVKKGLVNSNFPCLLGRNDVCIRRMLQYVMYKIITSARTQVNYFG